MTKEELKNKYSTFITEISKILGLGKPIDILKLCAATDLFFRPLEKRIAELEKENAELKEHHKNVCKNLTDTHRNIREQLTEAKEIIKIMKHLLFDVWGYIDIPFEKRVNNFLKEVNK